MKRLFKKAFRDLFANRKKAAVTFLAMLVGMVSFGTALFSSELITNELIATYSSINPSSATISVNAIDDTFIDLTRNYDDIEEFEIKAYYKMRGQKTNGEWVTVELFSSSDYENLTMNKVFAIDGSTNPAQDEMLIERDAMIVADKEIDDSLNIQLPNGTEKKLLITGVVNDLGVHPATMHNTIYVYVSPDTLESMGLVQNRVDIKTTGDPFDREQILTISNDYMRMLETNGYQIKTVTVEDTPGISMHLEEYKTALFLLKAFSLVSFVFTCLIMSSLLTSILSKQIKQMGILKAIGAKRIQITISYLLALFALVAIASISALPLSRIIAVFISEPLIRLSNMSLTHTDLSPIFYAIFCITCLVLPIFIAYPTIRKGTGITVKDAINDNGIAGVKNIVTPIPFSSHISKPVMLTVRNALRNRKRFFMNVSTLVISGICFITILVSMMSVQSMLDNNMDSFGCEYRFTTSTKDTETIEATLQSINEINAYEFWGLTTGKLVNHAGDFNDSYMMIAIPENSKLITPTVIDGNWLNTTSKNEVVVSHSLLDKHKDLKIGSTLTLKVGNQEVQFVVSGVIQDFSGTFIYMNKTVYEQVISEESQQDMIQVTLNSELKRRKRASLINEVEEKILNDDISILQSDTKVEAIELLKSHYMTTFQTFLIVIIMISIISSFGLASTTNIQTLERTKEIGIMKSVGASKKQISKTITSESLFISLISWIIAIIFSIPALLIGINYFSKTMLEAPISINWLAVLASYFIWLLLTLIIAKRVSKKSTLYASNITIKDSLLIE